MYLDGLRQAGLQLVQQVDFTPYLLSSWLPGWVIRLAWRLGKKLPAFRRGSQDIFVGGFALAHLYRQRLFDYKLLHAMRP